MLLGHSLPRLLPAGNEPPLSPFLAVLVVVPLPIQHLSCSRSLVLVHSCQTKPLGTRTRTQPTSNAPGTGSSGCSGVALYGASFTACFLQRPNLALNLVPQSVASLVPPNVPATETGALSP